MVSSPAYRFMHKTQKTMFNHFIEPWNNFLWLKCSRTKQLFILPGSIKESNLKGDSVATLSLARNISHDWQLLLDTSVLPLPLYYGWLVYRQRKYDPMQLI